MTYEQWLQGLGAPTLSTLLKRRPEVALDPPPRTFGALAHLLQSASAVGAVSSTLDRGALDLLAVFALLGDLTRAEVGHWTGEGDVHDAGSVDTALRTLESAGLVWPDDSTGLREYRPVELAGVFACPFGMGRRQRTLFRTAVEPKYRRRLTDRLGIDASTSTAQQADAVVAAMTPDRIVALFEELSDQSRTALSRLISGSPNGIVFDYENADDAFERGLIYALDSYRVEMPFEVSLALRGTGPYLPAVLAAPDVATVPVQEEDSSISQSIALVQFCEKVQAVVDHIDTHGLPTMKSGGVSTRAIKGLSKDLGLGGEFEVSLVLSLAAAAHLVAREATNLVLTVDYEAWKAASRGEQSAKLVAAWWCSPITPTHRIAPGSNKTSSVLKFLADNPAAADLRRSALEALDRLGPHGIVTTEDAVAFLQWQIPRSMGEVEPGHAAAMWNEASAIGVVAMGSATELSRSLTRFGSGRRSDARGLEAVITPLLADLTGRAPCTVRLLPDSTVVVSGPPTSELSTLLGRAAVPESRDVASMWRFTPTSIRSYLDAGGTAAELLDTLTEISITGVPQALDYLIKDCARRHGSLIVREIPCCIVAQDAALLNEVEVTPALAALGFRRLAPTVLISSDTPINTLRALRLAGYAPVRQSTTGEVILTRVERPRVTLKTPTPRRRAVQVASPPRVDPGDLATRLVAGTPAEVDVERVSGLVSSFCRLPARDLTLLSDAIAQDTPVGIDYVGSTGSIVRHVISDVLLQGHLLHATSSRAGRRESFALSNIKMVVPV